MFAQLQQNAEKVGRLCPTPLSIDAAASHLCLWFPHSQSRDPLVCREIQMMMILGTIFEWLVHLVQWRTFWQTLCPVLT